MVSEVLIEQGGTHGALSTGNLTLGLLQHIAAAAAAAATTTNEQQSTTQYHSKLLHFCWG
jgi:hypothetical protein